MEKRILQVGHSPDADDAFMFYGLSCHAVTIRGMEIRHVMEDIQRLNERALKGELEVTAISAYAYPYVADRYWIMKTGSSMGEGYGPILVSKKFQEIAQLKGRKVATPGPLTTARLLFHLYLEEAAPVDIPFDQIVEAVLSEEVDAGILIHEGQLTFDRSGLHQIIDFGRIWTEETNLPLPLGLDVVRKDLGEASAKEISLGLQASIRYGYEHQDKAIPYALQFGRGLDAETGARFVKMYVNDLTVDMGERGKEALTLLFRRAYEKRLIEKRPEVVCI
ncbi:MAG: MqnA/MqnD/SBP family protein [bacterium]